MQAVVLGSSIFRRSDKNPYQYTAKFRGRLGLRVLNSARHSNDYRDIQLLGKF